MGTCVIVRTMVLVVSCKYLAYSGSVLLSPAFVGVFVVSLPAPQNRSISQVLSVSAGLACLCWPSSSESNRPMVPYGMAGYYFCEPQSPFGYSTVLVQDPCLPSFRTLLQNRGRQASCLQSPCCWCLYERNNEFFYNCAMLFWQECVVDDT